MVMTKFPFPALYNGTGPAGVADIQDRFAQQDAPKLSFNYFVQFTFRSNSGDLFSKKALGGLSLQTNHLPVKQSSRIKPQIEYDDINFYGYRSKVAKKTTYGSYSLTFYDDSANRVHSIVDTYMEAVSPLTTRSSADDLKEYQTIGALKTGSEFGIIEKIELLHVSVNQQTKYKFYNPKISEIEADDLDMTKSEASSIKMTFTYDAYNVEKGAIEPAFTLFLEN